jgi:Fic family protein
MKYKNTHPFLTFTLDTARFEPEIWMLLGECQSKCEHLSTSPISPELGKEMHTIYLQRGAIATSAIEGNPLTEAEFNAHKNNPGNRPQSEQYLYQEIENIIARFYTISHAIEEGRQLGITPQIICAHNRAIFEGLPGREDVRPGELRSCDVTVGTYRAVDHEECFILLEMLCKSLREDFPDQSLGAYPTAVSILQAVYAHLYIAWIHPFQDGNGRTARLLEVQLLLNGGLPAPAVHLLSNHYNRTRSEYYRHLDLARGPNGVANFVRYALRGLRDGLIKQLELLWNRQMIDVWRRVVGQTIGEGHGERDKRKRALMDALSDSPFPVDISDVSSLSATLTELYGSKHPKTLQRDVQDLLDLNLVVYLNGGLISNFDLILNLLPLRKSGNALWSKRAIEDSQESLFRQPYT